MIIALLVFIIGASLASFLSVWGERGSLSKAAKGRSVCGHCHRQIKAQHLVPVVSWLLLRGRCDACRERIPLFYILFEIGVGLALTFLWERTFGFGDGVLTASVSAWAFFARDVFFMLVFSLLFVQDYVWKMLPDRITIPAIVAAFVWNVALGRDFADLVYGAVAVGGFFLAQYLVSRGTWVGGGDVRFGILLGALLGFVGGVAALGVAYGLGAIVAIFLLVSGKATRKTALPFGTFLAVGGYLILLLGDRISTLL